MSNTTHLPQIIVVIKGGMVQQCYDNLPLRAFIEIIDLDIHEGEDPEEGAELVADAEERLEKLLSTEMYRESYTE